MENYVHDLETRSVKKTAPSISAAEMEVIKTLWDNGPLAARDVFLALPEDHGWAYKTVKTLLARLVAKGAVTYEQIGNSYLYEAACSREQVTLSEVAGFVDRVLDGSVMPILHFIDNARDLSEEELDRLENLLKKNAAAVMEKGRKNHERAMDC